MIEALLPGGARVTIPLPQDATEQPADALPRIEVGGLPGARVALRRGFEVEGGLVVRVACVEAPSDRWAPGVEELALGVASGLARGAVAKEVALERWDAAPIVKTDHRFEQRIEGAGVRRDVEVALRGRHLLGFAGEAREAVLCTVVCDEPSDGARCGALVDGTEMSSLVEPPPPSALVKGILLAAERPREAGLVGALVCLGVVSLILARRPRPRR
ncbi:hypothetical protein [Polyangium aurulentum]|uniref:hypothetical protein n=1 Tax=Polyangium aurulentum TaxID=2567896 RepID=UPI001F1D15BF|nr:hypothetical protein [Polyangium aurulentum]